MFEEYRDSLPIIKKNNPFLNVMKVSIDDLDNYINHKLWFREKNSGDITELIDTLIGVDKKQNIIIFKSNKELNYCNLVGIEDLNNNYNESDIDFESFIGKKVKITNKNNNSIYCVVDYIEDDLIYFAVRLANYETLSYDLSYPINLIKKIEKMSERDEILLEYSRAFREYINKKYVNKKGLLDKRTTTKGNHVSYSKIDGCIFAHIIKNKLDLLLKGTGYHTSINNSYIKGCFTEWDLLICKGKPKYNIYDPEDVICAIELKAGGLAGYNDDEKIGKYFTEVDNKLTKVAKNSSNEIKFLYISLNENEKKGKKIKRIINSNKYKGRFSYYFVTKGNWHYSKWNGNNLLPSERDDDRKLDEVLKDILGAKTV